MFATPTSGTDFQNTSHLTTLDICSR